MSPSTTSFLPTPSTNQTYVTVSPIEGGFITLPEKFFISPADPDARKTVPSLSFLITHPGPIPPILEPYAIAAHKTPIHILFDLGLRRSTSRYLPIQQTHLNGRQPYRLEPGVAQHLRAGGLEPDKVDAVFLSHVHYDHHGDPEDFPESAFVVGHGAPDVLQHGLPGKGSHQYFQKDLLPRSRTLELPSPMSRDSKWAPLGPFPAALDLFGDASVYIIDTPGHLPGHMNLLCRTGPQKWVCLAGDAFHDKRLLTGEKEIGTWQGEGGEDFCIHIDKDTARSSIERLRKLQEEEGVEIVAAHDVGWWEENKGKLFPAHL
ncbi:Metallo-hydrolase/oxidoreductase [Viridothelium virens]|uniref:Metallo-hydrolase/oxidoreductase n=1 Tax=Viridothelium virens TaxID=1048519 RepID=A0A6A6H019_VIRVR|nr:Metallo-hydrolase/oxidoreductase [Viridothelium virens]